jgi:AraC family transcriptional regulator, transcriptional activator of pobA
MEKLFRIIDMTGELAEDIASKEYDANFHDFEELVIVSQGSLAHYIDFKVEDLKAPFACYIAMGKCKGRILHYRKNEPERVGIELEYSS